jgi:polyhydroxyalkanoate synthesis regulator phasin
MYSFDMTSTGTLTPGPRTPKAGRDQVFDAADKILRGGHRPTGDAIKALLGGGSPNSIVAYLGAWYAELADRLNRAEAPAAGLTPEVHRAALHLQMAAAMPVSGGLAAETAEALIQGLRAETTSQQVLLQELRDQRIQYVQRIADARALLARRDEELQGLRNEVLDLKAALAVADDRLRRRAARMPAKHTKRKTAERKQRVTPKATTRKKPGRIRNAAKGKHAAGTQKRSAKGRART